MAIIRKKGPTKSIFIKTGSILVEPLVLFLDMILRAKIERHSTKYGGRLTARHFVKFCGKRLSDSTVQSIKKITLCVLRE